MNIPSAVLIAEKPSQASSYAAAFKVVNRTQYYIQLAPCSTFPKGAYIVWCFGHLLALKEPHEYEGKEYLKIWNYDDLPILFQNPELKVQEDVQAHYEAIKKIVRNCVLSNPNDHTVWLCCDPDREGSAIGWNFVRSVFTQEELQRIHFKRLFIKSYEKDEIFKGFQRSFPIERDKRFATEAFTRAVADFIVGINASRAYTILINNSINLQQMHNDASYIGKKQLMRVGRVQSSTLYLVYERQLEIENFVPKDFYELYADFQSANGMYRGKANVKEDDIAKVHERLAAHQLMEGRAVVGYVKSLEKEQKRESSPMLHSLTTLQTKANKRWHMTPKAVLDTVQSLYEKHKLLTYPRTDCQFITEAEFEYIRQYVEQYKTVLGVQFENRYTEPRNRYVRTSEVQEHYAIIPTKKIPSTEELRSLTEKERNIYLEVLRTTLAMFHDDYVYEKTTLVTDLNGIEFKTTGKVELSKGFKELWSQEEALSDESSDKDEEENQSIPILYQNEPCKGIPQIKEGVTKPPQLFTEGELLKAMETCGNKMEDSEDAQILKEVSGIGTVATRADIIENLKATQYIEVSKNRIRITDKGRLLCISLEGTLLASPVMTAKWESYLKKIGEGKASPDKFLHSIEMFVSKLIQDAPVRIASKVVQEQIRQYIEKEKQRTHFGRCPRCKKGEIVFKKSFYGCTEYQNGCTFQIWPSISQKKLTENQVRTLIEKGKTGILKGFISKKGNEYSARIVLNDEYKVEIEPVFKGDT